MPGGTTVVPGVVPAVGTTVGTTVDHYGPHGFRQPFIYAGLQAPNIR